MVNPVDGLLGKSEFLPAIATVKKWLDAKVPQRMLPEHRPFKSLPMPKPDPEEAKRRLAIAAQIKAATKRRSRAPLWDEGQTLKPSELEELERYIADPETP